MPSVQPHQRRILGRIVDEIGRYRDGRQPMLELLNNAWALFEAAEVRDPDERDAFMSAYDTLSGADDANQRWMPPGLGSEAEVNTALVALERWARAVTAHQGAHDDPDIE
jgi:uncharacterized protein with von Willebrand factor type A (vWA) domain